MANTQYTSIKIG